MSSDTRGSTDASEDSCHFCDEAEALDEHHIVPRRFGGGDESNNLVTVCPTCHRKLESLYDKRFYDELDVNDTDSSGDLGSCDCHDCNADADHRLKTWEGDVLNICTHHKECDNRYCDTRSVRLLPYNYGVTLRCENHSICSHKGCESRKTLYVKEETSFSERYNPYCEGHIPDDDDGTTYEVFWE